MDADAFWARLRGAVADIPDADSQPPDGARVGAVLALIEDSDEGPRLVLTRRRRDMRSHPGQLSFPGGRLDEGETVEQAALREAEEEIGLDVATVEIAGTGPTFYIPPSRFWVVPVVARWREPHGLRVNPWEVDEVLHVPISRLLERDTWRTVRLSEDTASWAWQLDDDLLWGATAIMVWAILDIAVEGWSDGLGPADLGDDLTVRPWEDFPTWQPAARLGGVPEVDAADVPVVSAAASRDVLRLLGSETHVTRTQVFEHAARAVQDATRRLAGGDLDGCSVTVLAGPGTNGSGGLATARLLASGSARVDVRLVGTPLEAEQVDAARAAGAAVDDFDPDAGTGADVVVDAMLGLGLRPPARGAVAAGIAWLERNFVPVVAVDLPSGLHPDDGLVGPCVNADVTVALGAPKPALVDRLVRPYVGDLYVADLGVPTAVWREAGVEPVNVFGRGALVRLRLPD